MESFKQFILLEDMTNPREVHRQTTKDIAPLYIWLTIQRHGKEVVKKNSRYAKIRDVIRREISQRAQEGEKEAKDLIKGAMKDKVAGKGQQTSRIFKEATDSSKYIIEKNPHDKLWYVMAHVGRNKWMPISDGFKDKKKAEKWAKSQPKVDKAARGEVGGV